MDALRLVLGLLSAILLTACTTIGPTATSTLDLDATIEARVPATLEATPPTTMPSPRSLRPAEGSLAQVTRVIDGDTVDVVLEDGSTDRVRLLGVDTPETFQQNKVYEYGDIMDIACLDEWGKLATDFAVERLDGRTVTLVLDPAAGERGSFGRLLAYVLVDGQDFNALLVEGGYARVYTEGNSSREEAYLLLQETAQSSELGLWQCGTAVEVPTPTGAEGGLRYDPFGPDRDCRDFSTGQEAQTFYIAAGGPSVDPHRLDGDKDGIACETLPGAP